MCASGAFQPSLQDYFVSNPNSMNGWAIINRPNGTYSTVPQRGSVWQTNSPCPPITEPKKVSRGHDILQKPHQANKL